jgi:D-glycero-D-manno-heptose 1,7-bisphosphate phosphatase
VTHAAGDRSSPRGSRRAAFLDRDGTLIEDRHYLADPASVSLMAGAAAALRALNEAGVAVVVVTNQSGIARGHFSEAEYERVEARVVELFAEAGARIDATYHCPHHPELTGPCACRKPGTLLYERAASAMGLDPARSLYVGDRWRDVAPALAFGGIGVLVATPDTPAGDVVRASEEARLATTLAAAVERFLAA